MTVTSVSMTLMALLLMMRGIFDHELGNFILVHF